MDAKDINLKSVRELYPIGEPFKDKQKTNSGKLIPYESIDLYLYKRQANCTCFVTSHLRIHSWIVAIGEGLASTPNITLQWKTNDPLKSEFIVNETDNDDEVAYRIIVYPTTGKILTQGRKYATWANEQFELCLNKVKQMITQSAPDKITAESNEKDNIAKETNPKQKTDNTDDNTGTASYTKDNGNLTPSPSTPHHLIMPTITIDSPEIQNETTINKSRSLPKTPPKQNKAVTHLGHQETPCDETTTTRRLDSIECSIVKIAKALAELIANHEQSNTNQHAILEQVIELAKKKSAPQSVSLSDDKLKGVEKQLQSLKNDLKQTELKHTADLRTLSDDHKRETAKYKKENEELRSRVINGDIMNEKIAGTLEANETALNELKRSYEARLKDKESVIQDILNSRHQERDSDNWETTPKRKQSYSDAAKTTSPSHSDVTKTNHAGPTRNTDRPTSPDPARGEHRHARDADTPGTPAQQTRDNHQHLGPRYVNRIHLIHDSTCKLINVTKLTARAGCNGSRAYAPTIENAYETVEHMQTTETLILHTGVNNLKSQSPEHVASQYKNLLHAASQKADRIVVSLPIPPSPPSQSHGTTK